MTTYTKPKLRERLKAKIQRGDKGGKPGQWSARKAQLLVQEYEKQGGGYEGERDERQKHLKDWGDQDWRNSDDGGERYLPEVAWKLLTPVERKETDAKKKKGDGQFVANTEAAKQARKAAEVIGMTAAEARKAIGAMDDRELLRRVRKAEEKHGKARKTVLAKVDERLAAD